MKREASDYRVRLRSDFTKDTLEVKGANIGQIPEYAILKTHTCYLRSGTPLGTLFPVSKLNP
jgi:hypothetical protein